MRSRRQKSGGKVVFDYRSLLDKRRWKGKKAIRMKSGPISYVTEEGVKFFRDHPFQLVKEDEANRLLSLPASSRVEFVEAQIEDIEDYYSY